MGGHARTLVSFEFWFLERGRQSSESFIVKNFGVNLSVLEPF